VTAGGSLTISALRSIPAAAWWEPWKSLSTEEKLASRDGKGELELSGYVWTRAEV